MNRFVGKVAIVTGSSNGIGRATAIQLAKEGAKVTITGRNLSRLEETKKLCTDAGVNSENIIIVTGDITNSADIDNIVKETVNQFKKIDILINNAGAAIDDPDGKIGISMDISVLEANWKTNVKPHVELVQKCRPYLRESKGEIINISSIAATPTAHTGWSFYAMAKTAIEQFTRAAAIELIKEDIRVNGVCPGFVETGFMTALGADQETSNKFFNYYANNRDCIPAGYAAKPQDMANVILFLAHRESSAFIIGQTIIADGGSSLVLAFHTHDFSKVLNA